MRALVLENDTIKAQEILDILQSSGHQGNVFLCMQDAKKQIKNMKYDVLIVDLKIPKRNKQEEDIEYGLEFIKYIFESVHIDFHRPKEVIVISGYLSDEIDEQLKKYPISVISYDLVGKWNNALQSRINQFENFSCDIVILTAVDVEFKAFKKWGWEKGDKVCDLNYYTKNMEDSAGERIRLVLIRQEGMGMVPATAITSKVIEHFNPKCVVMSGICAGRKGAVDLGDVIVGDQAWDYGSGSLEEERRKVKLVPAPDYIRISQDLKTLLEREYTDELLAKIKEDVKEIAIIEENGSLLEIAKKQLKESNKIHFGAMATGAAVIKSENFTTNFIKSQNRKYSGIDMETYGMYYAAFHNNLSPQFFCIKAVTDVADISKGDEFQEYCANVSALLVKYYIEYIMNI
ncbi:MAG: hypothetical protein J1E01_04365 [Acetatifactor sp.]|nr:hypothetical protein [Acetatifactor sp.]